MNAELSSGDYGSFNNLRFTIYDMTHRRGEEEEEEKENEGERGIENEGGREKDAGSIIYLDIQFKSTGGGGIFESSDPAIQQSIHAAIHPCSDPA